MRKLAIAVVVCVAALAGASAALAQAQAPFTQAELLKCVADTPDFIKYMEAQGEAIADVSDANSWAAMAANRDVMSYLSDKGWNPQRYIYVFQNLSEGYVAAKMGDKLPEMEAQMAAAMNQPGMTPEMQAQMMASMGQLQEYGKDVPASEMQLIKANMPAINAMYESLE